LFHCLRLPPATVHRGRPTPDGRTGARTKPRSSGRARSRHRGQSSSHRVARPRPGPAVVLPEAVRGGATAAC